VEDDWIVDGPYHRCRLTDGSELHVLVGTDDADDLATPCDFTVHPATGGRFGGLAATIAHLEAILDRWRSSGEGLGGAYLAVPHLVILREGSVSAIRAAVQDLADDGAIGQVLEPVPEDDGVGD
jgi:hypothetical protein